MPAVAGPALPALSTLPSPPAVPATLFAEGPQEQQLRAWGVAARVRRPAADLIEFDFHGPGLQNTARVVRLGHGLVVSCTAGDLSLPLQMPWLPGTGHLWVTAILAGRVALDTAHGRSVAGPGQALASCLSPDERYAASLPGDGLRRSVSFFVDPQHLADDFGIDGGAATVRAAWQAPQVLGLGGGLLRMLGEIADVKPERPLGRMLMESKALQLMHALLVPALERPLEQLLKRVEIDAVEAAAGLTPMDLKRVQDARHWLGLHLDAPCAIERLARQVGTNPNKLMRDFRSAYGLSIAEWFLQQRMGLAQELLAAGDLSIKQVAYRVGYRHQSSFTAAYRAQFGAPPSARRPPPYRGR